MVCFNSRIFGISNQDFPPPPKKTEVTVSHWSRGPSLLGGGRLGPRAAWSHCVEEAPSAHISVANWEPNVLGGCKHICSFCIVEIYHLILEYILNVVMLCIISCFMFFFFLLMTDLLCILYLFETREMTLDKKQIQAIFLFRFKMGQKAAATTHNIYSAFGRNGWWT